MLVVLVLVGKVRKKLLEEVQGTTGKSNREGEAAVSFSVGGNGFDLDSVRDERGDVIVSFPGGRSPVPSHVETSIEIDV